MPLKPGKATVGATTTVERRDRIKALAEEKHWTVAQTLGLFIERYWDEWEKELGITPAPSTDDKTEPTKRKSNKAK